MLTGPSQQQLKMIVIAIVAAVVIAAASLTYQHFRGPHELSPAVRDSIAALAASRRADSLAHAAQLAKADSALRASEKLDSVSTRLTIVSRQSERHAANEKHASDSLIALARVATTASDSAARLWAAWRAERARSDTLQVALDTVHAALDTMRASRDSARASARDAQRADSISTARLARVEQLNADLKRDAARLSGSCEILPFVPCPSRKAVALVGIPLTAIATAVLVHKHDNDNRSAHAAP